MAASRSVVLLVLTALAFHADAALTIVNHLSTGGIFIMHPPGCCSPFGFAPPPPGYTCARCPLVLVEEGNSLTLSKVVGPYPIRQMILQLPYGKYVCVGGPNITELATLSIEPGTCDGSGTPATVSAGGTVTPLCLGLCTA